MDVRGWKKILLQFITECSFTERNFFNIEQSDICEYFQNFCKHHHKTEGKAQRIGLVEFLKENYPKFEANVDDANGIVAADYIYAYSLLLHFCCVKYPDPYFHEKCQNLTDQSQNVIAAFFKHMLQCEDVDRNVLRQAIEEITQIYPRANESSSSSSTTNFTGLTSLDSPTKTPHRSSSSQRISPHTPKSFMLEERTRELYHLRAQLETERYEKGVLEVQIKQMEEKISRLNQDHKNLHLHIQDLKNDILTRSSDGSEGGSPDRNGDEEIKRRLCKEISQKEEEISKLTDLISTFKEEKLLVEEKLIFAERKIVICVDRMNELDNKVDELGKELEEKDKEIKYLIETKLELERHVSETRKACAANRLDLNSTADCLDSSFSHGTNSSGSVCSPENLGSYGVDIQLREKESENNRLREELSTLMNTNGSLARHIQQVAKKHSEDFDIEIALNLDDEENANDPAQRFVMFTQSLELASKNYKDQQSAIKQLSEENSFIHEENGELNRRVQEMDSIMNFLKGNLEISEKLNMQLETEKSDLNKKLCICQVELETATSQKLELVSNIEKLQKQFDDQWKICEEQQTNIANEINKLSQEVQQRSQENANFVEENANLKKELTAVRMKLQEGQEIYLCKTNELDAEIRSLNDKLANQKSELETSRLAEHTVKEKYEELLIQCETMKNDKRDTGNYLQTMRTEMAKKELEMTRLGLELSELCTKKTELEERIEGLTQESNANKQLCYTMISHKEQRIKEIDLELSTVKALLEQTKAELHAAEAQSENNAAFIKGIQAKLDDISAFLQVPLLEGDVDGGIQNIITKIKELFENKMEANHKIECLELSNVDNSKQITALKEKIQIYRTEREEQAKKCKELKKELKKTIDGYEAQIATLKCEKEALEKTLKDMEVSMQERCSDTTSSQYKMQIVEKERELNEVLGEYDEIKSILLKTEKNFGHLLNQKSQLEQGFSEKLKLLTAKLQDLCDENLQLKNGIESFKENQTKMLKRFKEGDDKLIRACDKLEEESSLKVKINEELIATKEALRIAEEKLSDLDSLKKKISMDEIRIAELTDKLSEANEENMRLSTDISKLTLDVDSKIVEQMDLLKSLESMSEKLKENATEYQRKKKDLKQKCNALQLELETTKDKHRELEKLIAVKECGLKVVKEEIHKERADWHVKLSELMQKLTEKTLELERIENSVLNIFTILENNANMPAEAKNESAQNWFPSEDTVDCCKLNQLRKLLNGMLNSFGHLNQHIEQLKLQRTKTLADFESLKRSKEKIQEAHCRLQNEFAELKETATSEIKILESRLTSQIERIEEDRQHLECVNDKLTEENNNLFRKIEELEKNLHIEREQEYQKFLREETHLRETISAQTIDLERMREQLRLNVIHLNNSEEKLQQALARAEDTDVKLSQLQESLKENSLKYRTQEQCIEDASTDYAKKCIKLQSLEKDHEDLQNLCTQLKTQVKTTAEQFMEATVAKAAVKRELDDVKHDYEYLQQMHKTYKHEEEERFADNHKQIDKLSETVSQLVQQLANMSADKEKALEDIDALQQKLEQQSQLFEECEAKLDELMIENETLKKEFLNAENNVRKIQTHLEQREIEHNKIIVDNIALRESLDIVTSRCEKQALELCDIAEHKRENEKLAKTLETNKTTVEALLREKDDFSLESKTLRDRLNIAEQTLILNNDKIRVVEEEIITAKRSKEEAYTKISKLEKLRDANEDKLRRLVQSMSAAENESVRQNLEIGALNTELKAAQDTINLERQKLNDHIKQHETTILLERQKLEERSQQYEAAQAQLREYEQNAKIMKTELFELKQKFVQTQAELNDLREVALKNAVERQMLEQQKQQLSDELEAKTKVLEDLEIQKQQLTDALAESDTKLKLAWNDHKELVQKYSQGDESKHMELNALQERLNESKIELGDVINQLVIARADAAAGSAEVAELRTRLIVLEEGLDKEQQVTAKLRMDNQILQAKYTEAKQKLEDEVKASEERIKENRLELEGKLEKMKNKMKTLYTEEITKMRSKQEREVVMLKSQKDVLEAQNKKYEEHNRKLSSQIVRLNDKVLEHQKENSFLQTKLKHLEERCGGVFKRPNSIQGSTISSTAAASSNLGSNLTMEDEEGELFNNTYLTDLKNGVCAEELQYRNSLVLPHLKCTYAAYDHGLAEDELKDGPNSLDDSMSALLSTTSGGVSRKKVSGVTHYKRPGPPTPSKHGGRLSLGGSSEPLREVLRETDDSNIPTSSSAKTPVRFGFFSSRFSLGNGKDEPPNKPTFENVPIEVHEKDSEAEKLVGFTATCTSTPRKSRDRCEQRHLLEEILRGKMPSPCPSGISMDHLIVDVNVPPVANHQVESPCAPQQQERGRCRQRFQRRKPSESGREASSCSDKGEWDLPQAVGHMNLSTTIGHMDFASVKADIGSSSISARSKPVPRKSFKCHPNIRRIGRPSLNLRGNIFMKHRSPLRKQTREQKDTKARKQRLERFNRNRHLDSPQQEQPENNNYADFNHNPSKFGVTRIVLKRECFYDSAEEEYEPSISAFMSEIDDVDLSSAYLDDDQVDIEYMGSEDTKCDDKTDKSISQHTFEESNDPANAERFEQLLVTTESEAPFEVQKLDFENVKSNASTSSCKEEDADSHKSDNVPSTSNLAVSPTASTTSLVSSMQHSRTIYGNSMVFHRRIPHINCTHVIRKSSIYVSSTGEVASNELPDSVLLIADETITLIDFMHMWSRMDFTARSFLVSSIFAIVIAIISLAVLFF